MDPTQKIEEVKKETRHINVVYAGGTISSMETAEGYREGGHSLDLIQLLRQQRPALEVPIGIGNKRYAYTGLSENLTLQDQETIATVIGEELIDAPDGVLVSHGTDSIEQTARFLETFFKATLEEQGKKIIITAANEDLDHPQTDAWDNLQFSLQSFFANVAPGVYVAFHGKLIPASEVVKMPYIDGVATYASRNSVEYIEATKKQEAADEAQITLLKEMLGERSLQSKSLVYDVNVIRQNHEDLLKYLESHDIKAIILNLYHSGTANVVTPGHSVAVLVERLRKEKSIVVFGVTETGEPTNLHKYEASVALREAGVVPLYDMTKQVAKAKLDMLADLPTDECILAMLKSYTGEISANMIDQADIKMLLELYQNPQADTLQ